MRFVANFIAILVAKELWRHISSSGQVSYSYLHLARFLGHIYCGM